MPHKYRALPARKVSIQTLKFAAILAAVGTLPPLPAQVNWSHGITDWGMDGNDDAGDCVECSGAHGDMVWSANATGTPVSISAADVLAAYSATTGYDPSTGANDNGTEIEQFLIRWRDTGYFGSKIAGYAQVDPNNTDHFKRAINDLGCLVLGVRLPKSAEQQFDAGQPWSVPWWSPIVGGHCVLAVSYGADGFQVVTWGKLQPVDWAFVSPYVDQAFACVSPLFLGRSDVSPGGLTLAQMEQSLGEVAA